MAFCGKCGAQIPEGAKNCPSCGATTMTQTQINDIEANKVMAILNYIGLLILVPLITGKFKKSPFVKFHFNQAIVLYIGYVVGVLISLIPFIGGWIGFIITLGIFVLQVICIIWTAKGETKSFPVINKIKLIK